jgi:hypothetical protein
MKFQLLSSLFVVYTASAFDRGCITKSLSVEQKNKIEAKSKAILIAKTSRLQFLNESMNEPPAVIPISVHFHVISSNNTNEVTNATIDKQMEVLNAAYQSTGFLFNLKSTSSTVNSSWASIDPASDIQLEMKARLRQGGSNDLNVFSTTLIDGILGYATFPSSYQENPLDDGVVIDCQTLPGGMKPYDLGNTLVHEVGHFLGLYHTFEGNSCTGEGDYVADTPYINNATYGCPVPVEKCPGAGKEAIENFMDYTDDACMNRFSPLQSLRMVEQFRAYRI